MYSSHLPTGLFESIIEPGTTRSHYYIYLDTQVNKAIGDQAPCEYFGKVIQQCETKAPVLGNIMDMELLKRNLDENCIPQAIHQMDFTNCKEFLSQRRYLMAAKMEEYYRSL